MIGLSPLTCSPSIILILRNSTLSPNISSAFSCLTHFCFGIWALITFQFLLPFLFLYSHTPTIVLLPSIFRKLVGMTFLFNRFILFFCVEILLSATALFIPLALHTAKYSILVGRDQRQPQVWLSSEVEDGVRESA